jgi:uncharacterized protein YcaQ
VSVTPYHATLRMNIRMLSSRTARRLAITRQRLAGSTPVSDRQGIIDVTRDLGCLQLDPISVVARSHLLVLWSRLGNYDRGELDALLWEERRLFEYWAHAASIVLTEDYPIHSWLMRRYPRPVYAHGRRTAEWLDANRGLRRHVLAELRHRGPIRARDLEDRSTRPWRSGGWTNERNVTRMLDVLWTQGKVMVAGRMGLEKTYDLAEKLLPHWTPRERLSDRELSRRATQRSLRALGVATARNIDRHFTLNRYPDLTGTLAKLEREGSIERVAIADLPGEWFVHAGDLPLIDRLEDGEWQPRTTLLSPFDNLIYERDRTELLFGFRFRTEIYVPKSKRQYGYYLLPILHGDELVGRIDATLDRRQGVLRLHAVHAEPGAPMTLRAGRAIGRAVEDLAAFLGATRVELMGPAPERWRRGMGA